MSKYFFILPIILITLSNKTIAQQTEEFVENDSVASVKKDTAENIVEDDVEKKNVLYFENVQYDTFKVDTRFYADDSIAFHKKQADFIYPIDENNSRFNRNKNSQKADTVTTSKDSEDDYSTTRKSTVSSSFLNVIIWTIIIVFLVVVIVMYIKDNNINMFAKRGKSIVIDDEINYDNIFEIDYNKQIESAFSNGDYNIAARLGFLKLLKLLSEKNIITYGIEKTNFDYQFQLINSKYYQKFNAAAVCYDYAWYSGMVITSNQYNQIIQQYKALEDLL